VLVLVGLALAIVGSDVAVSYTRALAARLGAPAFVVGVVLVALGTDLPEIANSIASHLQDAGDVNVGDSVGSTLTQYTFVLGLFPLVVAVIAVSRRQVGVVTLLTAGGLGLTALLVSDGHLGRPDGVALVGAWALATLVVVRTAGGHVVEEPPQVRVAAIGGQGAIVLASLGVVGLGATVAVRSLVDLAEELGVPEFVLAFFGASLGTSAPEIAVDLTALARGAPQIALGDALGSSMIDATLSIGAGPIVARPTSPLGSPSSAASTRCWRSRSSGRCSSPDGGTTAPRPASAWPCTGSPTSSSSVRSDRSPRATGRAGSPRRCPTARGGRSTSGS
jgi:cation:H+ antiporter